MHVWQDELGNLDPSPERDQPQPIVIQPSSVSGSAMAADQAGERTALAGANDPSAHRTEYTMSWTAWEMMMVHGTFFTLHCST